MKSIKDMSMEELAGYVCSQLEKEGIKTVLSGGSCVEIYSEGKYTSDDIDLVDRFNGGHTKIKNVMVQLGFKEHNRYFVHQDTRYFIEFPRGPLGVGDAPITEIASRENETGILRLLTPNDCIKDRLAAYYHWDDPQSLEQAIWVAQQNKFYIDSIKEWSMNEKELDKFEIFKSRLGT
ncbi:MAG TPA: hypothetical protein PLH07_02605 [Sulfurovum sp.]|nr:MAG: hypothetical protein B7Y23_07885 [Sulfurovum sp. 16-42-52]OZA44742.1 MAG: hypothetical protein B7X80_06950 [Sulfurovum sp. 17-42-90]OZA59528.1 MAG: hypothetical protein B7X69_07595 [Sulfurovum sp. 39-42-12]HQR74017.1 hypothetical protein [Sulfurovum sp.]HQS71993.1 hypothetical protein [Sulfurovum sp.]